MTPVPPRGHAAAPPPASAGRPDQARTQPRSVSGLLRQLYAGPGDPGFEPALRFLRDGRFPDRPADRAEARRMLAQRGWYIPALMQQDSGHFDDALELIFRHAVVPDLDRPEVTEEIARWAGEWAAPPPVIRALNAAAYSRTGAPALMGQVLEPPLGRRWLLEHGIYPEVPAYAAAASRGHDVQAAGRRPPLALPEGRWRRELYLALALALLCVVLVVALVLLLP